MGAILAVLEQREGSLRRVADEVLAAAARLAGEGEVHALAVGPSGLDVGRLGEQGADRVFLATAEGLTQYQPDAWAQAAVDRVRAGEYAAVVLAATALGRDLAPRIAAGLACPLVGEAIELERDGGIVVRRPAYSAKTVQTLRIRSTPAVITVRPNQFAPEAGAKSGDVERVEWTPVEPRTNTVEYRAAARARQDVGEASVVVSGGRGLKDPEQFRLIEELAEALGGAVGASRAVVDQGWRSHAEQVGQTGKTVSPELYVAVGISGAVQHVAGMRSSKVIVAINKDPEAPIFQIADYGLVGDLFEILPRLTEEVRRLKVG